MNNYEKIDLKGVLDEINNLTSLLYKFNGNDLNSINYCPICNEFSEFNSFGIKSRPNVKCPICGSLERHRLSWLVFKYKLDDFLFKKDIKLLHFAPEKIFYNVFREMKNVDYFPVDLFPEGFEKRNIKIRAAVNMENIPFDNETFDIIYNSHVLEHVPNDITAMKELYRVLKKGGYCVVLVPIRPKIDKTLEKEEYNTPELRLKYYGQEDHVRYYGMDIVDRLKFVGFNVEIITEDNLLVSDLSKHLYNLNNNLLFLCKK